MNFQLNAVEEPTWDRIDRVTTEQFRKFCILFVREEDEYRNMTDSIEEQTWIKA